MVTLPPMEPDAWEAWRVASIRGYATDGDNAVARHLYQAVGYDETNVTMMKRIG